MDMLSVDNENHFQCTKVFFFFSFFFFFWNYNNLGVYLRGNCTPNQKLACFVLYLKIVNTFFFSKMMYAS